MNGAVANNTVAMRGGYSWLLNAYGRKGAFIGCIYWVHKYTQGVSGASPWRLQGKEAHNPSNNS